MEKVQNEGVFLWSYYKDQIEESKERTKATTGKVKGEKRETTLMQVVGLEVWLQKCWWEMQKKIVGAGKRWRNLW